MPSPAALSPSEQPASLWARLLRILRPSHQHTAFSATLLLMAAVMLSRVMGYSARGLHRLGLRRRDQYRRLCRCIQSAGFPELHPGRRHGFDHLHFHLYPLHFARGGQESSRSLQFHHHHHDRGGVHRHRAAGDLYPASGAPDLSRTFPPSSWICAFTSPAFCCPDRSSSMPAASCRRCCSRGGCFSIPRFSPIFYNVFIIVGGLVGARRFGISSLAYGALVGAIVGPFLINVIGAAQDGLRYRLNFDWRNQEFREWVRLSIPLMLGVSLVSADDWILRYFASGGAGDITRLNYAKRLFAVPISILGQATGQASMPFFARLFGEGKRKEFAETVNGSVYPNIGGIVSVFRLDDAGGVAADRPGLPARTFQFSGLARDGGLFLLVRIIAGTVVGAGALLPSVLCRGRYSDAHDRQHHHRGCLVADLFGNVSSLRMSLAWRSPPTSAF